MSHATLMVHVDVVGEMGAHVKVAGELAKRFRAHLIGISGWAPTSGLSCRRGASGSNAVDPALARDEIHTGYKRAAVLR